MNNNWHDAKTDPPKKDGEYIARFLYGDMEQNGLLYYKNGQWRPHYTVLLWTEIPPLPDPELDEFEKWWEDRRKSEECCYHCCADNSRASWRAGRAKLREGK